MQGTHSEELGRGHSRLRSQGQGTSSPLTSPGAWSLSLPPGSGPQTRLSVCDSCRSSVGRQGSPLCMPHRSSPAVVREAPQPPRQGPGLPVRKASFSHFTDGRTKAAQEIEGPGRGPPPQHPPSPLLPTCKISRGQESSLRAQPGQKTSPGPCVLGPVASPPSRRPPPPPCLAPTPTSPRALAPASPARPPAPPETTRLLAILAAPGWAHGQQNRGPESRTGASHGVRDSCRSLGGCPV